jgi:hypothetical protein
MFIVALSQLMHQYTLFGVTRQSTRTTLSWATKAEEESEDLFTAQQAQIKQGWSLLATLHCVLLPDKVVQVGSKNFKRPQVEMMARRWQHQCLEVCLPCYMAVCGMERRCLICIH